MCRICLVTIIWYALAGAAGRKTAEVSAVPLPEGRTALISGTVYKEEFKNTDQRIYLKNISVLSSPAESLPQPKRETSTEYQPGVGAIVYLKEPAEAAIGSRVLAEGVCAFPQPQTNPGGFDAQSYYGTLGISVFLRKARILQSDGNSSAAGELLRRIRNGLRSRLYAVFEKKDAELLGAMMLGERASVPEETEALYQDVGIIHILAISGLHISLIGMGIYQLLRKFPLPAAVAGFLAGGILSAYAVMCGASVSALRAVVMFCLFLTAQISGRTYDLPTALSLAAAALVSANIGTMTQAGFLLSFGAVCGVLLAGQWSGRALKGTAFGVSLSVQIMTLPLVAYFYSQVSTYGVLLNLIVIPAVPMILASGAAAVAASCFGTAAGQFFAAPAHYLLALVEFLSEKVRLIPGAVLLTGKPGILRILIYYVLLGIFYILCGKLRFFQKIRKIDLIKLTFALILFIGSILCRETGTFTMTFLDVGQGDGCCIETANDTVWMIDGGSGADGLARYCLEPFLKSRARARVDYWMVSHFDGDHTSGLLELLTDYTPRVDGTNAAGITIGALILPKLAELPEEGETLCNLASKHRIPVYFAASGDVLRDGELQMRILAPEPSADYENDNAASMVAEVSYKHFLALLTGDVEGGGEQRLLKKDQIGDVDVLKAAHHGSKYTMQETFLEAASPEVTVISCGRDNRYGHPHEELLQRIEKQGSAILRTDRHGAVQVAVTEKGYQITCQRNDWQAAVQ